MLEVFWTLIGLFSDHPCSTSPRDSSVPLQVCESQSSATASAHLVSSGAEQGFGCGFHCEQAGCESLFCVWFQGRFLSRCMLLCASVQWRVMERIFSSDEYDDGASCSVLKFFLQELPSPWDDHVCLVLRNSNIAFRNFYPVLPPVIP